jgi:branched-chain amino acid aminotransferase
VRNGILATPHATDQILEGITRDTLIVVAGELGFRCAERQVDRTELYDCAEAFLCSTGLEILKIASVDGLTVGDGATAPITEALRSQYRSIVRGGSPLHDAWRTAIY